VQILGFLKFNGLVPYEVFWVLEIFARQGAILILKGSNKNRNTSARLPQPHVVSLLPEAPSASDLTHFSYWLLKNILFNVENKHANN
jgi:hypothetical protein